MPLLPPLPPLPLLRLLLSSPPPPLSPPPSPPASRCAAAASPPPSSMTAADPAPHPPGGSSGDTSRGGALKSAREGQGGAGTMRVGMEPTAAPPAARATSPCIGHGGGAALSNSGGTLRAGACGVAGGAGVGCTFRGPLPPSMPTPPNLADAAASTFLVAAAPADSPVAARIAAEAVAAAPPAAVAVTASSAAETAADLDAAAATTVEAGSTSISPAETEADIDTNSVTAASPASTRVAPSAEPPPDSLETSKVSLLPVSISPLVKIHSQEEAGCAAARCPPDGGVRSAHSDWTAQAPPPPTTVTCADGGAASPEWSPDVLFSACPETVSARPAGECAAAAAVESGGESSVGDAGGAAGARELIDERLKLSAGAVGPPGNAPAGGRLAIRSDRLAPSPQQDRRSL